MTIAVIPARGGSKRIPRKNIRQFAGKPIIAYSIETALATGLFDRVVVSTDCEEIADVARRHGAEVPYMRSLELADDYAGTMAVIRDAMERLNNPSLVCCIYATAPLLSASDIDRGYRSLIVRDFEQYAFSVVDYQMPIERALRMSENRTIAAVSPEHSTTRTQDLPRAWCDAAQFYWCRRYGVVHDLPLYSEYSVGVPMPPDRVCDIDTEEDWQLAERLHRSSHVFG